MGTPLDPLDPVGSGFGCGTGRCARLFVTAALVGSVAAVPFARGDELLAVLRVLIAALSAAAAALWAARINPRFWDRVGQRCDAWLDRLDATCTDRSVRLAVSLGMLLYAVTWSVLSILRHNGLNSSGFDLAIQHQVVWNLAHGRGFESSIEVAHYLGDHVAITLPLFAPLLWIWDDVRILLIAQSCLLAVGAWPLYRLARRRCGSPIEGGVWVLVYLLTPAIGFINKYDFHSLVLSIPLLLAAIDAIDAGRLGHASLWMWLAVWTREEVGLAVAGLALWGAIVHRRYRWGGLWIALSVGWAVFALKVVIPHFRHGESSDTLARYAWLGSSPGEIVKTLLTRPWTLFATHYHRVRRLVFPLQLLWPLAGLPLFSWGRLLLVIPNAGLSFLSSAVSQNSIYFQYNAPVLPTLFWAGIGGYRWLRDRGRRRGWLIAGLLFAILTANIADPAAFKSVPAPYTIVDGIRARPNLDSFLRLKARIPPEAGVLASNDLAPHLSARRDLSIFHLERPNRLAPWVILDLTDTRHLTSQQAVAEKLAALMAEGDYRVDAFEDGIVLLRDHGDVRPDAQRSLDAHLKRWDRSIPVQR